MPLDPVDHLLNELVANGGQWPPRRERRVREEVRTYRAFLESDRDALREIAGWPKTRDYKIDPLAELIADAWADHVLGEPLAIEAPTESDQSMYDLMLAEQDFDGEAHDLLRVAVGEGEGWWRVYRDEDVADVPLFELHRRDDVIPLYVGRRLAAAALVTELEPTSTRGRVVWRHLEIHTDGAVEHVLFRGTRTKIGETRPLEDHAALEDLAAALPGDGLDARRWEHGLPMLMGRLGNGRRIDRRTLAGISDYRRISDYLLDLNEAATIAAENVRLTAKRRVVVPEEALRPTRPELLDAGDGTLVPVANGRHTFDAGEDVLVVSKLDAELGQAADGGFKVLEYSYDATALIAHKRDVVESALTRVGLTPQYVGVITGDGDGLALTGTALRVRLIPTTKAGQGKAKPVDEVLPHVLSLMARLDELPVPDGGFGRQWTDPTTPPSVDRGTSLPADDVEDAQVDATLVNARLRSRRTSIERRHPDWTPDMVDAELDRIDAEQPASSAATAGGFGLS